MGICNGYAHTATRLRRGHAGHVLGAVVVGITSLLEPAVASAAGTDEAVSLTWQAPAECPDRGAILERLRSLLVVSKASGALVTARGTVVAGTSDGTWGLTLETVQGERTWKRTIQSASCDELADAAALIIALVVDPDLMTEAHTDAGASAPPAVSPGPKEQSPQVPAAPLAAPVIAHEPPEPDDAHRATVAFVAGATAVADLGSLPSVAFGAEIAVGLHIAPVRIEAVGTLFPPVHEVIRPDPESGGDIGLVAGGLRGCYWAPGRAWRWGLCGGVEAGSMYGEGFGTTDIRAQGRFWGAVRLGAFATYPLAKSLSFRASLEGLVPWTRPEFLLENVGQVHQPWAVSGRLQLGFDAHFE